MNNPVRGGFEVLSVEKAAGKAIKKAAEIRMNLGRFF
jgi:hypothetical protein